MLRSWAHADTAAVADVIADRSAGGASATACTPHTARRRRRDLLVALTAVVDAAEPESPAIGSVEALLAVLSPITADGREVWYRGHRNRTWTLEASTFRTENHRNAERAMLARFRQEAAATGMPYAFDEWGWIAFAQHHELPTCLLDWSQSPLVALYFAWASASLATSPR